MKEMGIMVGTSETEFSPKETYTAEQAIATIIRLYNISNSNKMIIGGADVPTDITISANGANTSTLPDNGESGKSSGGKVTIPTE